MASLIKCKNCGVEIEVSEALKHQIEDEIVNSLEEKHKREIADLTKKAEEKIKEEVKKESLLEVEDLKKQLEEKEKKVDDFREKELLLREEKRKLEEKEKELALEVARTIDEKKKEIEEKILAEADEKKRFEVAEKDKIIDSLKRSLDEAQRKASLTSQQLQGEVMELDLEKLLKSEFVNDEILPIEKGVSGADIKQIVKTSKGTNCGVILWESKRTKSWSPDWIQKLKSDLRAEKANSAILVSEALPKEVNGFGIVEGIQVCSYEFVLPVVELTRQKIIEVAYQKFVSQNKGEKAEVLYEYINSHEFRQQVESLAEVYREQVLQIAKERAAFEKIWKARESQARRIMTSSANIYGKMQGIVGASMPQIKALDLLEIESGENI